MISAAPKRTNIQSTCTSWACSTQASITDTTSTPNHWWSPLPTRLLWWIRRKKSLTKRDMIKWKITISNLKKLVKECQLFLEQTTVNIRLILQAIQTVIKVVLLTSWILQISLIAVCSWTLKIWLRLMRNSLSSSKYLRLIKLAASVSYVLIGGSLPMKMITQFQSLKKL